jgi:hypothetical protein
MPDNDTHLLKDRPRTPWNKGKLIGAKPPLRPKHVWAIRTRLMVEGRIRDLAMFNLAIDSKLRGCDVVALKVDDGFEGRASSFQCGSRHVLPICSLATNRIDGFAISGCIVFNNFLRAFSHLSPLGRGGEAARLRISAATAPANKRSATGCDLRSRRPAGRAPRR